MRVGGDAVAVVVFDVTGRRVEQLPVEPDTRVAMWDGLDTSRKRVAGVYFIEVVTKNGGTRITERVVLK